MVSPRFRQGQDETKPKTTVRKIFPLSCADWPRGPTTAPVANKGQLPSVRRRFPQIFDFPGLRQDLPLWLIPPFSKITLRMSWLGPDQTP